MRELEKRGIGRPSTYAEIIGKVQARDYVEKVSGGGFAPTMLGKMVVDGLVKSQLDFMDPNFTASMEEELDDVGSGKMKRTQLLKRFYTRFRQQLDASKKLKPWKPEAEKTDVVCDECGAMMQKKWGRKGYFLSCERWPDCKGTKNLSVDGTPVPVREDGHRLATSAASRWFIKSGKNGEFIGCSGYPACKNTRPVPARHRLPRSAAGDLIEIRARTRGGRTFYGCANYAAEQKCQFKLWQKPVAIPCPQCSAKFLTQSGGKRPMLLCATKDCGYKKGGFELDAEGAVVPGQVAEPMTPAGDRRRVEAHALRGVDDEAEGQGRQGRQGEGARVEEARDEGSREEGAPAAQAPGGPRRRARDVGLTWRRSRSSAAASRGARPRSSSRSADTRSRSSR